MEDTVTGSMVMVNMVMANKKMCFGTFFYLRRLFLCIKKFAKTVDKTVYTVYSVYIQ